MDAINPLNYLGLVAVGAALLWAVHLIYGARRTVSDDTLLRVLLLAGWVAALAGLIGVAVGVTGPFGVLVLILLVVVAAMYLKYVGAERRALLWALAVAAEKGIPLDQAARAFAQERSVQLGLRAARLAELLEAGAPLSQALLLSRNPVSADALLAARLGCQTGQLASALRMSLAHHDHVAGIMRSVMAQYAYFLAVLWVALISVTFIMLKIIPVFARMFAEFQLRLPALTDAVIAAMQAIVANPYLYMGPAVLLATCVAMPALAYYVGWSRYEMPLFHRCWRRRESALVMRALGWAVARQQPLSTTIELLAHQYPKASIAKRLTRSATAIQQGLPWTAALLEVGLIKYSEAAVLQAAERTGNLAWALEEMADSALRRSVLRIRALLGLLLPVFVILVGLLVGILVIGLFMPLVSMIQGLS
jgi:general secretion pathway protein F